MDGTLKVGSVMLLIGALVVGTVGLAGTQAEGETTGRQIIENVDTAPTPADMTNRMRMTLIDSAGETRERTVRVWSRGRDKSAMAFLEPDSVRGTGFLRIDREDTDVDDMWLYLPDLNMLRRIDADQQHQSFMGTDFTYDDMGDREIDEYTWTLLDEDAYEGHAVYIVEGEAKDPRQAGYSKIVTWVREDIWTPVQIEYYDLHGELEKIQTNSEIEKIEGYWVIARMEMANVQTEHRTELQLAEVQLDVGVPDEVFTSEELPRLLDRPEE
ncbi:MAG: outer membrane lipoprotein-sorting protein [Candidatus Bipolaricaulota bacterium]